MKKNKKCPYKIVKSDRFKKQEKNLPPKIKKELDKVLKKIAKNPEKMLGSMSVFGPPSPEELKQWMNRVKPKTIDLVFEYLNDKDCLTKKGKKLARGFWLRYIKGK